MSSRSQSQSATSPRDDDDDGNTSASSTDAATHRRAATGATEKKVSCQPCREAKVKCIPSSDSAGSACSRCIKLERDCFYRTHKRGRKPGKIKLQQILRRLELLDRTLVEIRELNRDVGDADATSLIETLMWQLHRSKFFSKGADAGAVPSGTAGTEGAAGVKHERHSNSPATGGEGQVAGMGMGVQKSRSDFNMLVDMEDHASVARVPDEFPTLSNPLKLLAQASSDESERRLRAKGRRGRDGIVEGAGRVREGSGLRRQTSFDDTGGGGSSSGGEGDEAQRKDGDGSTSEGDRDSARKRARSRSPIPTSSNSHNTATGTTQAPPTTTTSQTLTTTTKPRSASSWASTYFSRGAFHPVYDNRQEFDPIDQNLLTVTQATRLITSFYASFGTFMHIFDPTLSTITYIRKHSAFLLTVICALSAEFESSAVTAVQAESAALALSLRRHYEEMITWITCGDYKNVEMAQAFFLLASYRPMSDSAMSDQTWLFLGTAIRIATELGCNLVCYSYGNPRVREGQDEHYQRQLRNTERLWLNLWNLEKTLASQTGQRMHLADEGVIATCSRWHRMPCALRQDEALIAQVELRRIMIAQGDHFNTHVLRSLGARRRVAHTQQPPPSDPVGGSSDGEDDALSTAERDQLLLQLSYFRNSVTMDLKRWEERWLSSSSSSPTGTPTPLQITGPLSLDYAALVTYALPLPITYSVDVTPELAALHRHCYISCTNYMATFVDRSQRQLMEHITNSTVISTVYAVVFALDLARKAEAGQKGAGAARVDFGFVSSRRVVNLARLTARELEWIGGARTGRVGRSVASKYSAFLQGVLARFEGPVERGEEEEGEEEGDVERAAVRRGFEGESGATAAAQTASTSAASGARPAVGKQGTRASHSYSSNLMFSPQPLPAAAQPQYSAGWTAPAPTPSPFPAAQTRYTAVPPHHAPTPPTGAPSTSTSAAAAAGAQWPNLAGAVSPASWFGHPGVAAQAGGLEDDPSWEWMMKDLDFFSVDGGGGGGEPILDQMGRLFG
ncbi:conserved hypothetical protein [Sporisorium reilianum SRZ2]|uniref:Zn(2)-C6 fungal-type domain-containing protein n=1 Tax=Sporisorium reilianum (strain SRZ2) TaxID=999809 RepID=E6ZQX4_SPORE|nr:conserved hypothetical protein [Sporisorium reilianum SRZ2]